MIPQDATCILKKYRPRCLLKRSSEAIPTSRALYAPMANMDITSITNKFPNIKALISGGRVGRVTYSVVMVSQYVTGRPPTPWGV